MLDSKLLPSVQWYPLPGKVNPQSSAHETSETSPFAFCEYSCARHKTALQISSFDLASGFTIDLPGSRRQYKTNAPIVPTRTAVKVLIASFLNFIESLFYHGRS